MRKPAMVASTIAAIAVGVFVALAQAHAVSVPYLTPTRVEFQGLEDRYPVNSSMNYAVSLKGYGSNCINFDAQLVRENYSLPGGTERTAYFDQTQDCRKINISQGPYNYTRIFSYSGSTILGKPGGYRVDVEVLDQITKQ
jgi:hypothetical protein